MSLDQVLFSALAPIVSSRVFPVVFPQGPGLPVWPAIRYTHASVTPVVDICGDDETGDTDDTRVQLDIVAQTRTQVRALRLAVLTSMSALDPPARRAGEFEAYDAETKTYRVSIDYLITPSSPGA